MTKKLSDLTPWQDNPRDISDDDLQRLKNLIVSLGVFKPFMINKNGVILGGNMRYRACKELGIDEVPVTIVDADTPEKQLAYALADNDRAGYYLQDSLRDLVQSMPNFDMADFAIDLGEFTSLEDFVNDFNPDQGEGDAHEKLTDKFLVPPFSVLDTRQGYWQDRKRDWLALGIKSEVGRENLGSTNTSDTDYMQGRGNNEGGSIFDPVLAEVMYAWFCPKGGVIADPFAGGSVRGIVAGETGHPYYGTDLRQEQIDANNEQAIMIKPKIMPDWRCDDGLNLSEYLQEADLIFSCPPYADLEVYSDDPRDLSTMEYEEFKQVYTKIISNAVSILKQNRFAVFVVGDVRDGKGFYRNFVSDTISAFEQAGAKLYNECVLITPAGTLPIRASAQFPKGRKVGKQHQNVLVFYKGDPKKIREELGDVEVAQLPDEE